MFRTNFQPRRLSSFSLGLALAVVLTSICALVQAQGDRKGGPVERVPKGAIVEGNKVTLKEGYEFVNKTRNTVAIRRRRTNTIGGSFSCGCSGDSGGVCFLLVEGTEANCNGDCTCKLIIVVNPGSQRRAR